MPPSPDTFWVHHLDPVAIELLGFPIRWYGLAYLAGLLVGYLLVRRWADKGYLPLNRRQLGDLATAIGIGMIAGGRLGYCILYEPSLLIDFSGGFPYWGLLRVNEGGMASHGGIIGFVGATWWFCRKNRVPFFVVADAVGTGIPLGIFFGRVANFINGELYGRPAGEGVPWAMHFPDSVNEHLQVVRQPDGSQFRILDAWLSERWQQFQEVVPDAGRDLFLYQGRLQPGSDEWQFFYRWMTEARHPSQLYAAALEGLVVFVIAWACYGRHRRPGLNAGIVLATYALVRIINENWRQWDIGHDPILGLTKGQLYSLPVLAVGLGFMIWSWRRGRRPQDYQPATPSDPVPPAEETS